MTDIKEYGLNGSLSLVTGGSRRKWLPRAMGESSKASVSGVTNRTTTWLLWQPWWSWELCLALIIQVSGKAAISPEML